jgi:hypothetical protein
VPLLLDLQRTSKQLELVQVVTFDWICRVGSLVPLLQFGVWIILAGSISIA